jgi:Zn-dependent M28 family amino/carboxypeptidase
VRQSEPIPGANDGGSGVGVLLEIARVIAQNDPGIGVDILLVDGEDNGDPGGDAETWCLGSQYWAQNRPQGYKADYAILLDMVGAKDAVFPREGTSVYFASGIVEKVWSAAANLGYGNYFVNNIVGQTTDDHLFINMYARIPAIDIVHYDPKRMDYGHFHHRHSDSMEYIDKGTLGAVGHVVLDVLFNEQPAPAQ